MTINEIRFIWISIAAVTTALLLATLSLILVLADTRIELRHTNGRVERLELELIRPGK